MQTINRIFKYSLIWMNADFFMLNETILQSRLHSRHNPDIRANPDLVHLPVLGTMIINIMLPSRRMKLLFYIYD